MAIEDVFYNKDFINLTLLQSFRVCKFQGRISFLRHNVALITVKCGIWNLSTGVSCSRFQSFCIKGLYEV